MKQIHWRIAGLIALVICGVMAWVGKDWSVIRESSTWFMLYWAVFFVALVVVLYCVLLDLRYIRAEYAVAKRDLFQETLGDEEFRRVLRQAQAEKKAREEANGNGQDIKQKGPEEE
jgi:TRAP-type C4-dicarboxylate transport system permease small subunit